ncbi:hypothetical protein BIFGAL_03919 [Bifidobacterium gallicum DSM 20093 = LMG 11596]|uniref:Uncharacterized protein n=1 Tax=Bifidobacterium gallicum DSM 20093 = LMG 11596 TaxID=561180 RepID=D1NVN0_9BIFI|nr:hypothetical protein BIFGAL_03919 [Bifidobacterium gallicum DSM 20093 = LMG 11596]
MLLSGRFHPSSASFHLVFVPLHYRFRIVNVPPWYKNATLQPLPHPIRTANVPPWYRHATDLRPFIPRTYQRGTDACIFALNPYRSCTTVVQKRYTSAHSPPNLYRERTTVVQKRYEFGE